MEKQCSTCRLIKSTSEFHNNKSSKDKLAGSCKVCATQRANKWVKDNLDVVVSRKRERRSDVRKSLLENAQSRAASQNLPLNITIDDIEVPEVCPILGVRLTKAKGKAGPNSPSLDRIVPDKGYVIGNVQVISYKANAMKNNASIQELLLFAQWVINKFHKVTK